MTQKELDNFALLDSEKVSVPNLAARRNWRDLGFAQVRGAVAVVLIVAATMKMQLLLARGEQSGAQNFAQSGVLILSALEACGEWLLAAWLLSDIANVLSTNVVMLVLPIFIAVTTGRLVFGSKDCGCFGALHVQPALTLAMDIGAFWMIYVLRPGPAADGRAEGNSKSWAQPICVALVLCGFLSTAVWMVDHGSLQRWRALSPEVIRWAIRP